MHHDSWPSATNGQKFDLIIDIIYFFHICSICLRYENKNSDNYQINNVKSLHSSLSSGIVIECLLFCFIQNQFTLYLGFPFKMYELDD